MLKRFFSRLNPFKRSKDSAASDDSLQEFVFIWYKRMETGGKTVFTQPFRTKIRAKNELEAKQKMEDFAMRKMELVIIKEGDESAFEKDSLMNIQKDFAEMYDRMEKYQKRWENYGKGK